MNNRRYRDAAVEGTPSRGARPSRESALSLSAARQPGMMYIEFGATDDHRAMLPFLLRTGRPASKTASQLALTTAETV